MQRKVVLYLVVFMLSLSIFAGLFPYPIFSNYTNVTSKNIAEINNLTESELSLSQNIEPKVVSFSWNIVNLIMEYEKPYLVIDIESGEEIVIERVGGVNHADIETIDEKNTEKLKNIIGEYSFKKRAVLLKFNSNLFIAGSLSPYPHGENKLENSLGGHMCLHFQNSKTHSTKIRDNEHQKMIKLAQKSPIQ